MKAKAKIPLIIVASVVGAILVAVIVLCSVSVRPLKPFTDYSHVRVETAQAASGLPDLSDAQLADLNKGLKKTGFSVMHALLEFVYSYSPKFETMDDPNSTAKKPPQVKRELTFSEVKARTKATDTQFVLEFWYDTEQTIKVEKETVRFDRMRMNVATTDGEVHKIYVYPYLDAMTFGEGNPAVQDYRITPIVLRLNTSPLYITLGEIKNAYV